MHGLELLAIASRLFQEGDPHGFEESKAALALLGERGQRQGLLAAVWYVLDISGWLGDLSHCWQCGKKVEQAMRWQHANLICDECGNGMSVSAGLRKSISGTLSGGHVRLGAADAESWRGMIQSILVQHGIKATDSFK